MRTQNSSTHLIVQPRSFATFPANGRSDTPQKKKKKYMVEKTSRIRDITTLHAAPTAHPPHPHTAFDASKLLRTALQPVKFTKVPPLEKLLPKLGGLEKDPIIPSIRLFIQKLDAPVKQGICEPIISYKQPLM